MKIYNKPGREHNTNNEEPMRKGITKVDNGYTIRHTINGKTYYYGCYKTLEEATKINHKLLTTVKDIKIYSTQHTKLHGKKYKQKIIRELCGKKENTNVNGAGKHTTADKKTHNTAVKNAENKEHQKKTENVQKNTEKNIHNNKQEQAT